MAPKHKIDKKDIVDTAISLIRKEGESSINARRIALELGCSTQPIFSNFTSMEELRKAVMEEALSIYHTRRLRDMADSSLSPYKASGISYILFAQEEKQLFKLLFMCDRTTEDINSPTDNIDDLLSIIQSTTGFSYETANLFHLSMWIYVHGIAVMFATNHLILDIDLVSQLISDMYNGLKSQYEKRG